MIHSNSQIYAENIAAEIHGYLDRCDQRHSRLSLPTTNAIVMNLSSDSLEQEIVDRTISLMKANGDKARFTRHHRDREAALTNTIVRLYHLRKNIAHTS